MTAASGAWKSEQQSQIYCQNTATGEGTYYSGLGNSGGIQAYSRTGLILANGAYAGGTSMIFEMRAYRVWGGSGCTLPYNKVDVGTWQITITYSSASPMTYSSSSTIQNNTTNIPLCSSNQEIIGIEVVTSGSTSPIDLTELRVQTSGSTDPLNDISNIDIYYTGSSSTFATATLFGSAAPAISGTNIFVNGTQTLNNGVNYFWVTYDIAGGANSGNNVDALCNRVTVGGTNYVPSITNPAGNRTLIICAGTPGGTSQTVDLWIKSNVGTVPSSGSGPLTSWTNGGICGAITINGSPTYNNDGYNFNPKIHFNGNGNYLGHSGVTFGSIYAVVELEDLSRVYTHLSTWQNMCTGPNADGTLHGGISGANGAYELTGYATEFEGAGVWKYDGIAAGHTQSYSGTHQIVSAIANSGDMDAFEDRLLGGQTCLPARDWLGDVSEVIVMTGTSTIAERDQIESYLAIKYGITMGMNGTTIDYFGTDNSVIWDQSANIGYNYDIAGIRRDDETELDQRKSHSENKTGGVYNDILVMANGTSFPSPAFITTDKSSVVWGHNNGALQGGGLTSFNTTNPETIEVLFQRHWKAQEEGTINTVTLQFDMSTVAGPGGTFGTNDLADVRLLVDPDGNFASGALSVLPSSYNNVTGIVEFQHDFVSGTGFYFTIGSINFATASLPIELTTLQASCEGNNAVIEWSTMSEINNDYFIIERSSDAQNWGFSGRIEGAGTTSTSHYYRFIDDNTSIGVSYYRLSQIDFDGGQTAFEVQTTNCKSPEFNTYPNPFENEITISFESGQSYPVQIEIRNTLGQVVKSNLIYDQTSQIKLYLDDKIPFGTYFLTIGNNQYRKTEKIVKIRR
ncbi:MAG: T9SS type A sorting domain-containing protein [Flavobacteriales bacterium]|nr:T9SS type A sorting domain-containing protein [Flavobacteriales bacterium]